MSNHRTPRRITVSGGPKVQPRLVMAHPKPPLWQRFIFWVGVAVAILSVAVLIWAGIVLFLMVQP
jgi:hypothetical protein